MSQNQWELIDFQAKFTEEYMQWCLNHQEELKDQETDIDALYYEMYGKWLEKPADWLGGVSPQDYFLGMRDVRMLVSAFIEYILKDIEVPDPLLEQLFRRAEEVYPIFLNILMEKQSPEITDEQLRQIQAQIIPLIGKMHKPHPYTRYIELLQTQQEDNALAEQLTEALMDVVKSYLPQLLNSYDKTNGYARMALLDLLSYASGENKVYSLFIEALKEPEADIAFLAGCLGRLGDIRAVDKMKKLIYRPKLQYYQFKEIKNAIEELSGEEIEEMDFSGDVLYEYLKNNDKETE